MKHVGRIAAVGLAFWFSVSCASTTDEINEGFKRLEGEPLQSAVDMFGRPDRAIPDGMGGKIVLWSWIKDGATVYIKIWVDKDDVIDKWQWRVRDDNPQTYYWWTTN